MTRPDSIGAATHLEGTIIGVDLDGVCSDFYGRMREIAAEWFERPLDELTTDVSYELREWGIEKPDQYESLHRFAVTQRQPAAEATARGTRAARRETYWSATGRTARGRGRGPRGGPDQTAAGDCS